MPDYELPTRSGGGQGSGDSRQAHLQYQRDQIAVQDGALEQLSKGVANLHSHAKNIGEEAELQNKMLDNLDVKVDQAHGAWQFNVISWHISPSFLFFQRG